LRKNKGFLELRRLEAAREIAAQLATSGNKVMLDSQGLLLNGKLCFCFSIHETLNFLFANSAVAGSDAKELLKNSK
jgi:prohibitin 2